MATPRIIGGFDAVIDRFVYAQISLQKDGEHMCGASLIAPDIAMSAAHCHQSFDTVLVNKYDLVDDTEDFETFLPVEIILHPGYTHPLYKYDTMLIKLDGMSSIDPVRINDRSNKPKKHDSLTVVGWGTTHPTHYDLASYPDIFQQVDIDYMTTSKCKKVENEEGRSYQNWITDDMMCDWKEGVDSCYGDSGSPLIERGDTREEDVQVGIVSWGLECAGIMPGVYSRLSFIHEWIFDNICLHSEQPPLYVGCPTSEPSESPSQAPSLIPKYIAATNLIPHSTNETQSADGDNATSSNATEGDALEMQPDKGDTSYAPKNCLDDIFFTALVLLSVSFF